MVNKKTGLLKSSDRQINLNRVLIINALNIVINKGIIFLSLPIFSRLMSPDEYGKYELSYSWAMIISSIIGIGVGGSLASGHVYFKDKYTEYRNSVLFFGFLTSVFMSCLLVTANMLTGIFPYGNREFIAVVFFAQAKFVVDFALTSLVYEKRPEMNFIISLVANFLAIILGIALIAIIKENKHVLRLLGMVFAYVIASFLVYFIFYVAEKTKIRTDYIKYSVTKGLPISIHDISGMVLVQSDRVMMQRFAIPDNEVGVYSFYYSFSNVLTIILLALNKSWIPFYQELIPEKDHSRIRQKSKNYIELFSVITIGFILTVREVNLIIADNRYWEGIEVIPILVCATYFTFLYQLQINYEFYVGKTNIIAAGTFSAAVTNIILNFVLIPRYGMYGAAIATAASFFALFLIHYLIVSRIREDAYQVEFKYCFIGLVSVLLGTACFYVLKDYWAIRWLGFIVLSIYELRKIFTRKEII